MPVGGTFMMLVRLHDVEIEAVAEAGTVERRAEPAVQCCFAAGAGAHEVAPPAPTPHRSREAPRRVDGVAEVVGWWGPAPANTSAGVVAYSPTSLYGMVEVV
jgi:hypothetical protein